MKELVLELGLQVSMDNRSGREGRVMVMEKAVGEVVNSRKNLEK